MPALRPQAFPVLTETVPFIIGRKGVKIDHIEKATGASLSIGEGGGSNTFGREWSYIHILGEGYQVIIYPKQWQVQVWNMYFFVFVCSPHPGRPRKEIVGPTHH